MNNNPSCWSVCGKKSELSADEIKCFDKKHINACLVKNESLAVGELIAHCSSLIRLKKAAAWLIRLKGHILLHRPIAKVAKEHLTISELQAAEKHLIINKQQHVFGHFILRVPERLKEYASFIPAALEKSNPIVVQGILQVGGQLDKALIDYDAHHPIIFPHVSHFNKIIINHFHVFSGYFGISTTLNSLFQQFWVVKPTSVMKRVLDNCMYCSRRNAKPGEQIMTELPPTRLQLNSHSFVYTGFDCFGPLMIPHKRSNVKRYGCLFTCLTTGAVHLEVSVHLSLDAFINALRRFKKRSFSAYILRQQHKFGWS